MTVALVSLFVLVCVLFIAAARTKDRTLAIIGAAALVLVHLFTVLWTRVIAISMAYPDAGEFSAGVLAFYRQTRPVHLLELVICIALLLLLMLWARDSSNSPSKQAPP